MPNLLQYPVAMFGAMKAGLIIVNTNPLYTDREMEHQFRDADCKAIVILENFAHLLQKIIIHSDIQHVIVTSVGVIGRLNSLMPTSAMRESEMHHESKRPIAHSPLDSRLRFHAVLERMLHQRHLSHRIGNIDQFFRRIPASDHRMLHWRARLEVGYDLREIDVSVSKCNVELIQQHELKGRFTQKNLRLMTRVTQILA